jgi:hypothetical protein
MACSGRAAWLDWFRSWEFDPFLPDGDEFRLAADLSVGAQRGRLTMSWPQASDGAVPLLSADELEELRTAVAEVPSWQLSEEEWSAVERVLQELHAAVEAGDARGVRTMWATVERASPRAARTRLRAGPGRGRERELVNQLIDSIEVRLGATGRARSGKAAQDERPRWTDREDRREQPPAADADPDR